MSGEEGRSRKGKEPMEGSSRRRKRTVSRARTGSHREAWNDYHEGLFQRYESYTLLQSRPVHLFKLYRLFPQVNLQEMLERQGLITFFGTVIAAYPQLVKRFYANIKTEDEGRRIVTLVQGKVIRFTVEDIARLFSLPNEGIDLYGMTYRRYGMEKENVLMELAGGRERYSRIPFKAGSRTARDVNSTKLDLPHRIILFILSSSLIPKKGHFDEIREVTGLATLEICRMNKVNWAKYVFDCMKAPKAVSLPYANLITSILQAAEVDLDEQIMLPLPKDIDMSSMDKMGLKHKFSVDLDSEEEMDAEEHGAEGGAEEEEEGEAEYDADFREEVDSHFQQLHLEVDDLRQGIANVQITLLGMNAMIEDIHARFPPSS